jgi:hypothetical protein
VLLFLHSLCTHTSEVMTKYSYGINTCDEGVVVSSSDVDGLRGPEMLELLKGLKSLTSPVQSLLKMALDSAVPCAAGQAHN